MLAAIAAARRSVSLECYIYSQKEPGPAIRDALTAAVQRGVRVRVLVDALGSFELPDAFWTPLREAGAEVRAFNPIALRRMGIRDHRKLLVCDGAVAFVGGFNIAPEYVGDGVQRGWCDLGMRLEGPVVRALEESFDAMFGRAAFQHKRFARLRRPDSGQVSGIGGVDLMLSGPGRGRNPFQKSLLQDLRHARQVRIVVPYFLPTRGFRQAVARVARRGGRVQLILPGKSDVALSQLAGRCFYRRLLRSGVEIFEYQPQILHAKLFLVNQAVYVGSSNLDPRSLGINYELMLRFEEAALAAEADTIFNAILQHSQAVTYPEWRERRTIWDRLKQRWAHFILLRVDPFIARRQWRALPD